jgi:hypothetical protein
MVENFYFLKGARRGVHVCLCFDSPASASKNLKIKLLSTTAPHLLTHITTLVLAFFNQIYPRP